MSSQPPGAHGVAVHHREHLCRSDLVPGDTPTVDAPGGMWQGPTGLVSRAGRACPARASATMLAIPYGGILRTSEQGRWPMPGYAGDKDQILTRLRRIEGQVRGLQRLVRA
jgi:hypothetical protein